VERLDAEHVAKVQAVIASLTDAPTAIAVSEVDCWPAPTDENYFGLLIHGLTAAFKPVTVLLYADILGVPETAQNQGQRMISVANSLLSRDITELCWANQSDNTGKAVNVAAALKLDGLRCVAHLLALGPRHLLHPVKRMVAGKQQNVAHERAQKDAYVLCEKIRRFVKHMLNREQEVRQLHKICKQLGLAELDLILDNSSKWDATPQMLDRIVQLETVIATYFREAGEQVPVDTVLLQKDFDFARELAGVLRPITNAIHLLEGDTFKGSVVLPVLWLLDKELMETEPVSLSCRAEKGKFVDVSHTTQSSCPGVPTDSSAGGAHCAQALGAEP
jgi:hypothetical protein